MKTRSLCLAIAMLLLILSDILLPLAGKSSMVSAEESSVSLAGYNELVCNETVVQPASTIFEVKEVSDIAAAKNACVNIIFVTVDAALDVVYGSEKLCSVSEFLAEAGDHYVPAFKVLDEESLSALVNYQKDCGIEDAFIVSEEPEILYSARIKFPLLRGVLDLRKQNLCEEEIIKAVNAGFSKIVFLKSESLTVDFVDTLRKRYLTVWAEDGDVTTVSAVKTILTGANGIAADSLQVYSEVYEDFFGKQNSIVRKSFFIGHRGSGATEGGYSVFGPENTLESAKKAYADGADYVEVDVHFTLDKELVIMHDSSLGTMMDATGTVETTSYADLKSYTYKNYDDSYRIPTLRQFIEYFKQTNCMLVIELKDYSKELADAVVALVREYNFENQCVIICFSKPSLGYVYENEPSIGLGALSSEDFRVYEKIYDEKHDIYKNGDFDLSQTLRGLFKSVQNYNCVYNPGYNVVTEEMIQQIQLRGLGVQAWTLRDSSLLEQFMMRGCASLTIDGVAMISDMIRSISANQTEYRTAVGEEAEVKLLGEYYSRSDYEGNKTSAADLTDDANAEPVLISGDAFELTDGNSWKAVKEGTSVAMYRYKMFSTAGQYYIYSQPFTLVAENRSEKGQGCSSVLDIPGLHWVGESLLVVTAVIILIRKRKSQ